ncbi:MAG: class I SAM-dependent methyltransferase [Candidatus Levybacteria bacterium]|nr:class I SAM-dependent methyltransferase [Candidatus Levybacteria bacterium]
MAEFSPLAESIYSGNGMGQHYTNPEHTVVQRSVALVRETDGKSVLDVACGRGLTSLALTKNTDVEHITAFDINKAAIEELDKTARKEGLPIHAVVFDAAASEGYGSVVTPESIDVAVAKDVYPFLTPDNTRIMLSNIHDALKPGGWLLITSPSTRSRLYQEAEPTGTPLYRKLNQAAKDYVQTDLDYFTFSTIGNIAELMDDNDIEMVEASHYGRAKGWIMALGQKNNTLLKR